MAMKRLTRDEAIATLRTLQNCRSCYRRIEPGPVVPRFCLFLQLLLTWPADSRAAHSYHRRVAPDRGALPRLNPAPTGGEAQGGRGLVLSHGQLVRRRDQQSTPRGRPQLLQGREVDPGRAAGRAHAPRPLSSAITLSGTRAGRSPLSTRRTMPGLQRGACHCSPIRTKA